MSNGEMKLGQLHIDHPGARERDAGEESSVWLSVFTPKGQLRQIAVSERQLHVLAQDATKFALILHDHQKIGQS